MATLVFAAAGAAIGGAIGGTVFGVSSAILGQAIGATLGRVVDQQVMGVGSQTVETGRVDRFRLTGASEGTAIPRVFGRARISGQVIWATSFKETITKKKSGGKGAKPKVTTKTYTYSVSAAIALCEGEISHVGRVWADGNEVAPADLNMRIYTGSENQLADPKIEAIEGSGNAPSYRGIAYVVFEDLDLTQFGNRFPQFSFEVLRPSEAHQDGDGFDPVHAVKGVALIPGTGEYALATEVVHYPQGLGESNVANANTPYAEADFVTSSNALRQELPNCNAVSLVVSWFGDDLRAGSCQLRPRAEQTLNEGKPQFWQASGENRTTAGAVPTTEGRPLYGGTPSDTSVLQAIQHLRESGHDVMFYPFILMEQQTGNALPNPYDPMSEQPALPWRGRITSSLAPGLDGSPDQTALATAEVDSFFGTATVADFEVTEHSVGYTGPAEQSYRRFILHYAHLCALAGGVESFCIGSEMRGLTQIRDDSGFPAVAALQALAADVRSILGAETKISYAADWSEYFGYHPQDGSGDVYFHLDALWADTNIDFIGIDNYMPLSDWRDGQTHLDAAWGDVHNLAYLSENCADGEGYAWFYHSPEARAAQIRTPIEDGAYGEDWVFRYKDIKGWWSNAHHNRIGGERLEVSTAWQAGSKPIRFTEYGCAAIDRGTNQPNKFLDPKSSESALPRYSNGRRDELMQLQYLRAVSAYWSEESHNPISEIYAGPMLDLDHAYVWAWDARPYPFFPNSPDVWSDGENYARGHWLNGRTAGRTLASVVTEICARSGVSEIDVSRLYGYVRGYTVSQIGTGRAALQPLLLAYGADVIERDGVLVFRNRRGHADAVLDPDDFALTPEQDTALSYGRSAGGEVAGRLRFGFVEADRNYEVRSVEASFPDQSAEIVTESEAPLVLTQVEGTTIAERWLSEARIGREISRFALPPSAITLGAGDVIELPAGKGRFRIDQLDTAGAMLAEGIRVEPKVYLPGPATERIAELNGYVAQTPVFPLFLDLPLISGDELPHAPHAAATAKPWPGSVAVYSAAIEDGYALNTLIEIGATIGVTETALGAGAAGRIDNGPALRVKFYGGDVASAEWAQVLAGANAVAIGDGISGDWEILQFAEATLVAPQTYELSQRLRGQLGTEAVMPDAWPIGSYVVVLDGGVTQIDLAPSLRNVAQNYRIGPSLLSYDHSSFVHINAAFKGVGLRPYAPAHLRVEPQTDGSWHIDWIRRTRIDGDSWDNIDVPLGEENEAYLLRILDGDTIRREEIIPSASWIYSAADQSADGALSAPAIAVAQISARFGAGPFKRIELNG